MELKLSKSNKAIQTPAVSPGNPSDPRARPAKAVMQTEF